MLPVCCQSGYMGREVNAMIMYCNSLSIPFKYSDIPLQGYLPFGSVDFVEKLIGTRIPNYYPKWAEPILKRKISNKYLGERCFVKPNNKYKLFTGYVCNEQLECDNLIYSEVVNFIDEWRIYVIMGKVICSWWYQGNEETCYKQPHAPELPFDIPKNFSGTIDVGMTTEYGLELVECHTPYAIGWYGDMNDYENYGYFITEGFKQI